MPRPTSTVLPVWNPTNVRVMRARLTASRQPVTAASASDEEQRPREGRDGFTPLRRRRHRRQARKARAGTRDTSRSCACDPPGPGRRVFDRAVAARAAAVVASVDRESVVRHRRPARPGPRVRRAAGGARVVQSRRRVVASSAPIGVSGWTPTANSVSLLNTLPMPAAMRWSRSTSATGSVRAARSGRCGRGPRRGRAPRR